MADEPRKSIVGDPQYVEVTATTDSNGGFDVTFTNHIDAVVAGGNAPQTGSPTLTGVNAQVTGDKTAHVRCFNLAGSALTSHQVTVTLIGLSA